MVRTNYKQKYLKYKLKYQKQILYGGNNCPVCGCPNCNKGTCPIGKTNLDEWVNNDRRRNHLIYVVNKLLLNEPLSEEHQDWILNHLFTSKIFDEIYNKITEKTTLNTTIVAPILNTSTSEIFEEKSGHRPNEVKPISIESKDLKTTIQEIIPIYEVIKFRQKEAMRIFFNNTFNNIKFEIYNELFNVPKNITYNQLIINLKKILKFITPKFINMCISEKSIYKTYCHNITMDWLNPSQPDCILHQLKQLPKNIKAKEFKDLISLQFEPYINLLIKYRRKKFKGITLIDIIEIVYGYLNIKNRHGEIPLHTTIQENNIEFAKLLIEVSYDLNIRDKNTYTPLHLAANKGHTEITKLLIEAGADVNAKSQDRWIPLHLAAHYGHTQTTKLLIEADPDVNAKTKGDWTPLHFAVQRGHIETTRLLIQSQVDLNIVLSLNYKKYTPLHIATLNRNTEIAKLLIQAGADLNILDKNGYTPLHIATSLGITGIANLLRQYGAI